MRAVVAVVNSTRQLKKTKFGWGPKIRICVLTRTRPFNDFASIGMIKSKNNRFSPRQIAIVVQANPEFVRLIPLN